MINHARTLLLNRPAEYFTDVPGSQYIDPGFKPLVLSDAMVNFQRTIIPGGIDASTENSVAASIMCILHCPELTPYTLRFDPRITYVSTDDFTRFINPAITRNMVKSPSCDVTPAYIIKPDVMPNSLDTAGTYTWVITPIDGNTIQISPSRGTPSTLNIRDPLNKNRSKIVTLIPGYLSLRFNMPSGSLTGMFTLTVSTTLPLPYNIADYNATLTNYMARAVFAPVSVQAGDPAYAQTIRELKANVAAAAELPIKFGCAILTYIYQCDALLRSRG